MPGVHVGHLFIMQLRADAKALQNPGSVGFRLPAAQLGEFLLQLRGPQAVLIGEVLLHVDGVLLLAAVIQPLVAHDDRVHDGVFVIQELVLLQHGHPGLGIDIYMTGGGLQFAGQDLDKGGLSGAVGTDDTVAVAGGELQVHFGKQGGAGELHGEIFNSNHLIPPESNDSDSQFISIS